MQKTETVSEIWSEDKDSVKSSPKLRGLFLNFAIFSCYDVIVLLLLTISAFLCLLCALSS